MKIEKFDNFLAKLHDKKLFHTHKKLKTNVKSWINIEKRHRVNKFYQEACLKPYIDMNTEPRKNEKKNQKRFQDD